MLKEEVHKVAPVQTSWRMSQRNEQMALIYRVSPEYTHKGVEYLMWKGAMNAVGRQVEEKGSKST